MLCHFCADLDLDQANTEEGVAHHSSYADLVASANSGCELCQIIHDEREKNPSLPNLKEEQRNTAIWCRLGDERDGPALQWGQERGEHKIRICNLDICTSEDDPLGKIICTRPISSDVSSMEFFKLVDKWIDECSIHHSRCSEATDPVLPTRVIDVGSPTQDPFLSHSHGRRGRWIALSHCWGAAQPIKTELSSLPARCAKLPLDSLPPLFQDAILITRNLGCQYLWIDSLCIIQDSTEDWTKEAANMGYIYRACFLTISAEENPGCHTSLFSSCNASRKPALAEQCIVEISCHSTKHNLRGNVTCGRMEKIKDHMRGPLSRRAWTLQENILPPRILRFGKGQVWWQCRGMQRSESIPFSAELFQLNAWDPGSSSRIVYESSIPSNVRELDGNYDPLLSWYGLLNDFTARGITFSKDRFPAISGVAKEVHRQLKQPYKAGLWRGDMHFGLLWFPQRIGARTPNEYVAPSWSWASLDFGRKDQSYELTRGLYDNSFHPYGLSKRVATIIDVDVANVGGDAFAQATLGTLKVEGPFQEICLCNVPTSFFDCRTEIQRPPVNFLSVSSGRYQRGGGKTSIKASDICGVEVIAELSCSGKIGVEHQKIAYLHVASRGTESPVALVLILKHTDDGDADTYRRIGMGYLREPVQTTQIWPVNTVTII